MEERSGLSNTDRFVAAVLYYCDLQLIRLDIYGLSNVLRHVPSCGVLEPFIQLENPYEIRIGRPERWYSYALRHAIDELVALGVITRVDYGWLAIEKERLRPIVRELSQVAPEIMDHTLGIVKAAEAIQACVERK